MLNFISSSYIFMAMSFRKAGRGTPFEWQGLIYL